MRCELEGFRVPCQGRIHRHHVVNRSRTRGTNAKEVIDTWPEVFLADVCEHHNVSRYADAKEARTILFRARVNMYGRRHVLLALAHLRKCFKSGASDLRLEALL